MIILLTGHRGRLGPAIWERLVGDGHEVRGFDLADGDDILDAAAVQGAAHGADAIVHAAGWPDDRAGTPAEKLTVNLFGTTNVLLAAEAEGLRRVVHLSSGKSLGMLERNPDYLPIDDNHRGRPNGPYGLAKYLSEEMCASFTERAGLETICLRPVAVFDAGGYAHALRTPAKPPDPGAVWHMGVHIDLRDLADATAAAIRCALPAGHARLLLCAADTADPRPTLELVAAYLPDVPWKGGPEFDDDPHRSLVDTGRARDVLGWQPRHTWPGRSNA